MMMMVPGIVNDDDDDGGDLIVLLLQELSMIMLGPQQGTMMVPLFRTLDEGDTCSIVRVFLRVVLL
jgi:hypothetical protein